MPSVRIRPLAPASRCPLQPASTCAPRSNPASGAVDQCNTLMLASECQAAGPVTGLATCSNGLLYSICHGDHSCNLQSWTELGLSPSALPPISAALAPTSVVAVAAGSQYVATAHKDLRIRLWRRSKAGGQLQQVSSLPSLRQYLHNWTLQHRYLQTRRHGKKFAWMQHADTISALAFSADCTLLYSASWDRTVKVWSLHDMQCQESFTAHIDSINAMVVGAADGLLYTGSADKFIKVWCRRPSTSKGRHFKHSVVVALQEQGAAVNALVMSRDGSLLYSGGSDGRVVVWRKSSPCWPHKAAAASQLLRVQEKLQGHARAVLCLDLLQSNDSSGAPSLLVSGSADQTIRVWRQDNNINVHECVGVVRAHTGPVRSLRVGVVKELGGVCGGVAFSGGLDGSIKMWMLAPATSSSSSATGDVDQEDRI
ncbi:hypothetical protein L7F22_045937 [Adiantum nelumboides]|nr:hypothetical protein [Adiantum nelumboides]MCO5591944.1 hypothetical protein [Adiantum nelumboides]